MITLHTVHHFHCNISVSYQLFITYNLAYIFLVAQNQSIPTNFTFENSFFFWLFGSVYDYYTSNQLIRLLGYDMFEDTILIHRISTMIYLGNRVTSQYSKRSIYFCRSSWSGKCIESCFGEHFNEKINWTISFFPLFLLN